LKLRVVPEFRALDPEWVRGRPVVVVDTLRATTTIAAAVAAGAIVEPVPSVAAARRKRAPRVLIAGERGGDKLPGFDLGNSPVDVGAAAARVKRIVLTTTNGTGAIARCAEAKAIFSGALVNAAAIARAVAALRAPEVVLLCAGRTTGLALEDLVGAGAIVDALLPGPVEPLTLTDGARLALELFRRERARLSDFLLECESGRNLVRLGAAADVAYCAGLDTLPVAPRLRRGVFRP
jgi:2-phosphosulfolactate phosphatase